MLLLGTETLGCGALPPLHPPDPATQPSYSMHSPALTAPPRPHANRASCARGPARDGAHEVACTGMCAPGLAAGLAETPFTGMQAWLAPRVAFHHATAGARRWAGWAACEDYDPHVALPPESLPDRLGALPADGGLHARAVKHGCQLNSLGAETQAGGPALPPSSPPEQPLDRPSNRLSSRIARTSSGGLECTQRLVVPAQCCCMMMCRSDADRQVAVVKGSWTHVAVVTGQPWDADCRRRPCRCWRQPRLATWQRDCWLWRTICLHLPWCARTGICGCSGAAPWEPPPPWPRSPLRCRAAAAAVS